jgi:hypothetical protein
MKATRNLVTLFAIACLGMLSSGVCSASEPPDETSVRAPGEEGVAKAGRGNGEHSKSDGDSRSAGKGGEPVSTTVAIPSRLAPRIRLNVKHGPANSPVTPKKPLGYREYQGATVHHFDASKVSQPGWKKPDIQAAWTMYKASDHQLSPERPVISRGATALLPRPDSARAHGAATLGELTPAGVKTSAGAINGTGMKRKPGLP